MPLGASSASTLIDAGGVAIVPLDTRWAAALFAGPAAPATLRQVRAADGTSTSGPTTWQAPSADAALDLLPGSPLVRRAVRVLGPHAVTLAVELGSDAAARLSLVAAIDGNALQLRLASSPDVLARGLVLADGLVSVRTFADAQALAARLASAGVRAEAFDGPAPAGKASTLVRLPRRGSFAVERVGMVSAEEVRRLLTVHVLFVCTGNTCRSPMAQAIGQNLAERLAPGSVPIEVSSAGVSAGDGMAPTPEGVEALRSLGIAPPGSRSRHLSRSMVADADVILTMTRSHARSVQALAGPGKLIETIDPDGADVVDPIGSPASVYRSTAEELLRLISARFVALQGPQAPAAENDA